MESALSFFLLKLLADSNNLFYSYPYVSVFRFCLIEEGLELLNGLHELASHDDGILRWINGVVNNVQAILH